MTATIIAEHPVTHPLWRLMETTPGVKWMTPCCPICKAPIIRQDAGWVHQSEYAMSVNADRSEEPDGAA